MLSFTLPEDPMIPDPDMPPPEDPTEPPIGDPGEPEPIVDPMPPGRPG